MHPILRSLSQFLQGILSRAYYWLFAGLLDPLDIYNNRKPENWPAYEVSDQVFWAVLAALVFWTAFLAFHEQRKMAPNADQETQWLGIGKVVLYLKDRSHWGKTELDYGPGWEDRIDDKLRSILGAWNGPRASGLRYPLEANADAFQKPKRTSIPRSFWKGAKFSAEDIRTSPPPTGFAATNVRQRVRYEEVGVDEKRLRSLLPEKPPLPSAL